MSVSDATYSSSVSMSNKLFSILPQGPSALWMLIPSLLFVLVFFIFPCLSLFSYSVMTQGAQGRIGAPFTLANFAQISADPFIWRIFVATIRISIITSILAVIFAYPVALVIARGHPQFSRLATIIIIAPLMVSIVVRTYGWQLLLANSGNGVVNWVLYQFGFPKVTFRVMFSETAVIIGSLHVFFPMMVLPLATALSRISPAVEEAAKTLGAPAWRVFWRVTLPLSIPGLAAGLTFVFSLTASSYVTPALLGGNRAMMLGNLLDQQITATYNWPLGAAIAVVMVVLVFAVNALSMLVLERRRAGGQDAAPAGARKAGAQ